MALFPGKPRQSEQDTGNLILKPMTIATKI